MERDHGHLHVVIPPKYVVSRVVEISKNVTNQQLKEKFLHVSSKVHWESGGVWNEDFRFHGGH